MFLTFLMFFLGIRNKIGIVAAMEDPKRFDGPSFQPHQFGLGLPRAHAPRHRNFVVGNVIQAQQVYYSSFIILYKARKISLLFYRQIVREI